MKIEIKEKNYKVPKRLADLIDKKLEKFDRYFDDTASCTVMCRMEKKKYILELTIFSKGFSYRSEVMGDNMYENLDLALPKIERQIIRSNDKRKDFQKPLRTELLPYEYLTIKPVFEDSKVVKKKSFTLDPISIDDAKILLETTQHDFYAYLDAETNRVNILYKRKDGDLGVIELNF